MKQVLVLLLLTTLPCWAQSPQELRTLLSACEFFAGEPLSADENQRIIAEARADFATDARGAAEQIAQLAQLGNMLSQVQDPLQLVDARQAGLVEFYKQASAGRATPSVEIVLAKARPLAFDPSAEVLLLHDDLQATLNFINYLRQAQGLAQMTLGEHQQLQQQLTGAFASLPLETKAFLVSGEVLWTLISHSQAQMDQARKAQFQQQMVNQTRGQMSADSYQALSNMSRNMHMTTMNILENMGDSGDYWTYERRPGW